MITLARAYQIFADMYGQHKIGRDPIHYNSQWTLYIHQLHDNGKITDLQRNWCPGIPEMKDWPGDLEDTSTDIVPLLAEVGLTTAQELRDIETLIREARI